MVVITIAAAVWGIGSLVVCEIVRQTGVPARRGVPTILFWPICLVAAVGLGFLAAIFAAMMVSIDVAYHTVRWFLTNDRVQATTEYYGYRPGTGIVFVREKP